MAYWRAMMTPNLEKLVDALLIEYAKVKISLAALYLIDSYTAEAAPEPRKPGRPRKVLPAVPA